MQPQPKFAVIGTSTVDFFISGLNQLPSLGEDEFTNGNIAFCDQALNMVLGGNGGNSAYVLSKLGASVILCSAVGRDNLAQIITNWQSAAGVDLTGLVHHPTAATSTTTVITDHNLNRLAFHHPGASDSFSAADLPQAAFNQVDIMLLTSYSLLSQWRSSGAAKALTAARQQGTITALDIGPAIGRPARLTELTNILPQVNYFICNAHELAVCTGRDNLEIGITMILDAGVNWVIIKRDSAGAMVRGAEEAQTCAVPGFAVAARYTVGAGDSFNAGFLFALAQGLEVVQAVQFGNATAALVVSAAQGVLGAPDRAAVDALVNINDQAS